jgi:DNA-binding transcriptional MerR regulator
MIMLETKQVLMQIREFSTKSRLSQKALRLYDTLGLLEPAHTDPQSGYRYYALAQLERAKRIGLLRQLEMPLQIIAEVLDLPSSIALHRIRAYWQSVEVSHRNKRGLVQYVEQLLTKQGVCMFEIKTRTIPERKIAVIGKVAFQPEVEAFIPAAEKTLLEAIQSQGATASEAFFVIYHSHISYDSDGLVEVCQPFTGALEPVGELSIRLEPAHEEAYTTMTKPQVAYPDIMQGYDAVADWLKAQGKVCSSLSSREVYFADWNSISDTEPAFDIAYPFA